MASSSSSLKVTILLCLSIFISVSANEVTVGGKSGDWKIPSSSSVSLNEWSQNARFKVGDTLIFRYEAGKDSVLQVTREAYEKCNTTSPKATYTDGNTKVKLDHAGPAYFISGIQGHCQKGQKLRVVVVSPRSVAFSPAPSPSELNNGPAVAPTTGSATKISGVFGLLVLGFSAFFFFF